MGPSLAAPQPESQRPDRMNRPVVIDLSQPQPQQTPSFQQHSEHRGRPVAQSHSQVVWLENASRPYPNAEQEVPLLSPRVQPAGPLLSPLTVAFDTYAHGLTHALSERDARIAGLELGSEQAAFPRDMHTAYTRQTKKLEGMREQLGSNKACIETQREQLGADKMRLELLDAQFSAERMQLCADKTELEARRARLEVNKAQLETINAQLSRDRKQLDTDRKEGAVRACGVAFVGECYLYSSLVGHVVAAHEGECAALLKLGPA
ncbi:hypothetical protein DFH07DRAFT_1064020 [Mycena maculata]|uniref:Uncharacterized protein n=1 Tax=Mycena maculata TaxID=230809 RepID=A0AAD7N0R0_9AGAR|nr:hypothetical protein DFH07DRAFT_1064020 [Mycena maculata]